MLVAPDLEDVAAFRATNMGGYPAVCPLSHDGSFAVSQDRTGNGTEEVRFFPQDGSFFRAFCAYEGLLVGVRTDGTLWYCGLEAIRRILNLCSVTRPKRLRIQG